jgi:hypothetical protein
MPLQSAGASCPISEKTHSAHFQLDLTTAHFTAHLPPFDTPNIIYSDSVRRYPKIPPR